MAITTLEKVKTILQISDTSQDDLIEALIPLVEADFLMIRNKAFDTEYNEDTEEYDTVYPIGSELTAIKMIQHQLSNIKSQGVSSESLGDYSISYDNAMLVDGYPKSVVGGIKKYATFV